MFNFASQGRQFNVNKVLGGIGKEQDSYRTLFVGKMNVLV